MKRKLFIFIVFLGIGLSSLYGEEIPYDRYAPVKPDDLVSKRPAALENWRNHFLVYPFELIRWPVNQTFIFVEKNHLYDKADWIYDQMKSHGFTPKVRSLIGGGSFGAGFDIEFIQLAGLKEKLPNTSVKGSTLWTLDHIVEYKAKMMQQNIGGTGLRAGGVVKYENRGEEHFYGIGPDTSLGDGTSYRIEQTTLKTIIGSSFLNTWDIDGMFSFQNANITNGEDGGRGIIDEIFVASGRQRIPGLGGDEILAWALELQHDNRDSQEIPTEGGYQKFHFSFNKGLDGSTGFFKYRGELGHFFKLFSDRRVIAFRSILEHNDEVGDRDVPFFLMSRLGGYGAYPRLGETHRGFKRDRFYDESLLLFNLEYRWTTWEYRDWKMDSVLSWDVGQVFGEFSDFQFEDFANSYGLGFRFSYQKEIVVNFEIARSHEGFEFYVKTKSPF
ncbi:MAG: BamA/TamA family outer membrane protein [Candidatus Omnitrophica bacterium]|nr:BamA/TamA family outer membrane protein [Candidatus Omnitrophota bacterium]